MLLNSTHCGIMQDHWIATVEFHYERKCYRNHMLMQLKRKHNMNDLHNKLGHPSENIDWATGQAMYLNLTDNFCVCKACTLGKVKKA